MQYMTNGEDHSLRNMVFNNLLEDILDGNYTPGETLVESKLAKKLGVSRTPIREAIKQLELEGLVTSLPNKRVVVQGITDKDIEDIYIIRRKVEVLAARWAASNITDKELVDLKNTYALMEFYSEKGDLEQIQELDTRFHNIIFQASKSKQLRSILASSHQFIKKARINSLKVPGRLQMTLQEHKNILEAIERDDPEAAEEAMKLHILSARNNLEETRRARLAAK